MSPMRLPAHARWLPAMLLLLAGGCSAGGQPDRRASGVGIDLASLDLGDTYGAPAQAAAPTGKGSWAIALATFTGNGHIDTARRMQVQLAAQSPALASGLSVRERRSGAVLVYGAYEGADDPRARPDMDYLRSLRGAGGRAIFPQVMLVRFRAPRSMENLHPNDLWSARLAYPRVDPLYSLDVAIWGDFESGLWPVDRRHGAAEQHAADLRRRGFEAWFYHDDDRGFSSVTVGLFDRRAIDAETGFYNDEVEAVLASFPERLINGEPLMESRNAADPTQRSPQQPRLIEVPFE